MKTDVFIETISANSSLFSRNVRLWERLKTLFNFLLPGKDFRHLSFDLKFQAYEDYTIQLNVMVGDILSNKSKNIDYIDEAADSGADPALPGEMVLSAVGRV